jgi:acetyltransferase-like isoleucine patch superfamily enzyme
MSSAGVDPRAAGFKISSAEDVEKSKMLRAAQYNHFDPTLVYERQRCERALDRYNMACKLDTGISDQEVRSLLTKVFDPSQDTTHKVPSSNHQKGHLGFNAKIETPFTCTYGYNIRISDETYIGKGCNFDDAGLIDIGPRTIIGPGVTILTTDHGKDLVDRKGVRGTWLANPVMIASGVIVGAKACIYPGVRIEEGATVEPCAVVRTGLRAHVTLRVDGTIVDPIARHGM